MDAKEVLKKMNENYFSVAAIRRCRKDENYEVGDICRNSFDWNYEKDESTFEDDEPVELSGTCGMRIENLENLEFSSPIGESTFSTPASRTPLFIRVPELFCGAKFKNCFSFSISYACAAFSLILCSAAQNSFYCRENSILPIPISYNFP